MSIKVLLKKDWKQTSLLWGLLVFLGTISFVLPVWTQIQYFDQEIKDIRTNTSDYSGLFSSDPSKLPIPELFDVGGFNQSYTVGSLADLMPFATVAFIYVVFALLMASTLIGNERNSNMSDFTMSLPFTRTQIYLSKWLIGMSGFIVATLLGGTAMLFAIRFSAYNFLMEGHVHQVIALIGFMILFAIAVFSICLWMGTFGGEAISQVAWSLIALLFPIGFLALLQGSIEVFVNGMDNLFQRTYDSAVMNILSPLAHLSNIPYYNIFHVDQDWKKFMLTAPLYTSISIALLVALGIWFFNRAPQENNGRFFLFTKWLWFIHIVMVLCFAMLGGIIFSSIVYPMNAVLYIVGFIIGGFLAHLLAKRLLYRFNLKLKS